MNVPSWVPSQDPWDLEEAVQSLWLDGHRLAAQRLREEWIELDGVAYHAPEFEQWLLERDDNLQRGKDLKFPAT